MPNTIPPNIKMLSSSTCQVRAISVPKPMVSSSVSVSITNSNATIMSVIRLKMFLLRLLIVSHRLVSQTAHGYYFKVVNVLKACAQPIDVYVDRVFVAFGVHAPNLVHQL